VDDSLQVLRAGKEAGIRWIYAIRQGAPGAVHEFPSVDSIAQL
jgi:hypothetical protein